MAGESYSVAIRLRLLDSVSSGLIGLAGQFAAFNRHVNASQASVRALETRLRSIKMMGAVGGALMGVGLYGLSAFRVPLEAAREYELAFTKFKTLNLGEVVNQQADHFARSADILGVSAKQLMTTMAESVGIFGNFRDAQRFAPRIAALNAANSAIFGGKINEIDEGSTRALMKFIDRRGLTRDEAGFNRGLDLAERLVTGSGGFVQFRDLAQFSQQGGTAFRSLSDTGLTNLALLLQEQGGARAGTAMMSIYQNLVAGRTPKKTMQLLQDYGFGRIDEIRSGTVGGKRSTTTTFALNPAYAAQLQADPVEFFRSTFLPQLAKHGITSEAQILKATNDLLSNRTASNQASIMTTQLIQIARDAALTKGAMGAGQVTDAYRRDPNSRWADLTAKYKNLMLELGETVLPIAIKAVGGLTSVIKGAVQFAREFPMLTKILVVGAGALAGFVAVGGAVTLAAAGFRALGLALAVSRGIGLGAQLLQVAGSMGSLGSNLGFLAGKLSLLASVAATAYALGTAINEAGPNGDLGGWLESKAGDWWHRKDQKNDVFHIRNGHAYRADRADADATVAAAAKDISPYIALPQKPTFNFTLPVMLDGKKIGQSTAKYVSQGVGAPQTGLSGFDGTLQLTPAGGVPGQ